MERFTYTLVAALCVLAVCCIIPDRVNAQPGPKFEHNQKHDKKVVKCESCQALVVESVRYVNKKSPDFNAKGGKKKWESHISDALDQMCTIPFMGRYEFAPPTMISACEDIMSTHGDFLEKKLFKVTKDDKALRQEMCIDTKFCKELWNEEQEKEKNPTPDQQEQLKAERKMYQKKHQEEEAAKRAAEKQKKEEESKVDDEDRIEL